MPAWWNSFEVVSSVTWYLRCVGASLTILGGLCVVATLATSKRAETLKDKRDADRSLTAVQRRQILDLLAGKPNGQVLVVSPAMSREPRKFALELVEVLKEGGWQVTVNDRALFAEPPAGLEIWMHPDQQQAPPRALSLLTALRLAGLITEAQFNASVSKDEVQLIVGFKR